MSVTATCDREGCTTTRTVPNSEAIAGHPLLRAEGWRLGLMPRNGSGQPAWCPEHNRCDPQQGHHVEPHIGCILR